MADTSRIATHHYGERTSTALPFGDGIDMRQKIANTRQPTTLERITQQQGENFGVLMEISRRINSMAVRLQGCSLTGSGEESGSRPSEGLLGDHLHALETETHLLGALMSDLDQLERLL